MKAIEILALVQSARILLDLGLEQFRLADQAGRFTEAQRAAILAAAELTDDQVDAAIAAARRRRAQIATPDVRG